MLQKCHLAPRKMPSNEVPEGDFVPTVSIVLQLCFCQCTFRDVLLIIWVAARIKLSKQNGKNVTWYQSINMMYLTIQYNSIYILKFPLDNGATMTSSNHGFFPYLHKQIH